MRPWLLVSACLLLGACRGKLVATADLTHASSADLRFISTGDPIELWVDTDGQWRVRGGGTQDNLPAHFEIDAYTNDRSLGHVTCDTADSARSTCSLAFSVGDLHRGNCEVQLTCILPPLPVGPVLLHLVGGAGGGATEVERVVVNVRAKR